LIPKVRSSTLRCDRRPRPRAITPRRSEFIQVMRAPFSQFAEGIRSIKLAADLNLPSESGVVIGIVSSLPGEGKSTIAANLAFLAASTGSRVLLVDCDMRKPALTYNLVPQVETGLRQVLTQGVDSLDDILWTHEATGLHLLPASLKDSPDNTGGLLNSPAMEQLLKAARDRYDYIILDFAPMLPLIDVRAAANLVDGFILVAEWAKAPRDAVSEAVSLSSSVRARLIGSVLNKVDMRRLRRYGEYDGKYYSQYFRQ
jgi:succinoglycan biosynthesis transport protein ExoP